MSTNEMLGIVFTGLVTILSGAAIIAKPLVQVVKTMTVLNESIKALTDKFNKFEINNHDDHKRIWKHNDKQDDTIQEHETRISVLENKARS